MASTGTPALQRNTEYEGQAARQNRWLPYLFVALSAIAALVVGIILPLQAIYQAMPATPLGGWLLTLTRSIFPGEPRSLVQRVPVSAPRLPLLTMWGETGLLFAAITFLFACYLLAVRLLSGRVSRRFILLSTLVLGLVYLLIPAYTSQDIYSYIVYARLGALYHLNPLTALPTAIPRDVIYPYVFWTRQPSAYGPIWAAITCLLQWAALPFGANNLGPMILLLRLWALAMHLGSVLLIWSISGRWQPRHGPISERAQLAALLAFAWNPLLLFEACVNAHIDTTILFFILLALWLIVPRGTRRGWGRRWRRNEWRPLRGRDISGVYGAVFVLALATCLKVTVVLFFPGLLLFLWAQRPRRLRPIFAATLIYVLTIVLLYAPFWQHGAVLDVFRINPGLTRDINTLYEFFLRLYEGIFGPPFAPTSSNIGTPQEIITHRISMVLFVVAYGALCGWSFFKSERISTLPLLVRWMALAWLLYCLIGSPWFWPWYMTAFFGLAALSMAMDESGEGTKRDRRGVTGRDKPLSLQVAFFLLSYSMLSVYCFSTWAPALTGVPLLVFFAVSDLRGLWAWIFLIFAAPLPAFARIRAAFSPARSA